MRYLSVCSGIEAATVAWHPLGWQPAAFSEIEAFPRAVLQHHYPHVPLHGDFTTIRGDEYGAIDLLVGGTPCQSFSVAGLRGGMDDERGQLALQFLRLLDRTRARWVVWENVPGVLSSNGGRDFGSFLGGLVELGYGFAYRVLDAQFFGVPQRRRRVFVVGHLGDWRRAAAVLFERHSLSGHPAPRREKGQGTPGSPEGGSCIGGWDYENNAHGPDEPTGPLLKGSPTGGGRPLPAIALDWPAEVSPTLNTYYGDKMGLEDQHVFNQRGGKFVPGWWPPEVSDPVSASEGKTYTHEGVNFRTNNVVPVAFAQNSRDELREMPYAGALSAEPGMKQTTYIRQSSAVRRLTPRECERLQGFPDDYTLVSYRGKSAADGPRYKALGNSMAVPVMAWIGERIAKVEALSSESLAA